MTTEDSSPATSPRALRYLLIACALSLLLMLWMYNGAQSGPVLKKQLDIPSLKIVLNPNFTVITKESTQREPQWDSNWDKRRVANVNQTARLGTRTIILIRHGKYDFSTGHLVQAGIEQANMTGKRLVELRIPLDRIVHSTMIRAVQTASIVASHFPNVPVQSDSLLEEGGPIPPHPDISYWGLPSTTYFTDGPRIEAAFRKYFFRADPGQNKHEHVALVGHGNSFRFFILRVLQLDVRAWMRVFIAHGSITMIHINPDGSVNLSKFGDSGHFPASLVTH